MRADEPAELAPRPVVEAAQPPQPADRREILERDVAFVVAHQKGGPEALQPRVRGDERVYLLPWTANYARVRVRKRRGERWFCTQDEAEAAGWRNAQNG